MVRSLRSKKVRRGIRWGFNLTPLVDIVFQLIVFFLVVSQVVSAGNEPVRVPQPDRSQAKQQQADTFMVVNLYAGAGGTIRTIKVNGQLLADVAALTDVLLRNRWQLTGGRKLLVRADRQIHYGHVRKVIEAISNAGITSVELAAGCEVEGNGSTQ